MPDHERKFSRKDFLRLAAGAVVGGVAAACRPAVKKVERAIETIVPTETRKQPTLTPVEPTFTPPPTRIRLTPTEALPPKEVLPTPTVRSAATITPEELVEDLVPQVRREAVIAPLGGEFFVPSYGFEVTPIKVSNFLAGQTAKREEDKPVYDIYVGRGEETQRAVRLIAVDNDGQSKVNEKSGRPDVLAHFISCSPSEVTEQETGEKLKMTWDADKFLFVSKEKASSGRRAFFCPWIKPPLEWEGGEKASPWLYEPQVILIDEATPLGEELKQEPKLLVVDGNLEGRKVIEGPVIEWLNENEDVSFNPVTGQLEFWVKNEAGEWVLDENKTRQVFVLPELPETEEPISEPGPEAEIEKVWYIIAEGETVPVWMEYENRGKIEENMPFLGPGARFTLRETREENGVRWLFIETDKGGEAWIKEGEGYYEEGKVPPTPERPTPMPIEPAFNFSRPYRNGEEVFYAPGRKEDALGGMHQDSLPGTRFYGHVARLGEIIAVNPRRMTITTNFGKGRTVEVFILRDTPIRLKRKPERGMTWNEIVKYGGTFGDLQVGDAVRVYGPSGEKEYLLKPEITAWALEIAW